MRNMRISLKLIISFLIVIALSIGVGGVGIFGMLQINNAGSQMYYMQTIPLSNMAYALEDIQKIRVDVREFLIASMNEDYDRVTELYNETEGYKATVIEELDAYRPTIIAPEAQAIFSEAYDLLTKDYFNHVTRVVEFAKAGDTDAILADIAAIGPTYLKINEEFAYLLDAKIQAAADNNYANDALFTMMLTIILIVLGAAIAISLFFAIYISAMISKPLQPLTAFLEKAGNTGDITLSQTDIETISHYAKFKDETGSCIRGASSFVKRITDVSEVLSRISQGDLTVDIQLLSENDVMGQSVHNLVKNMNDMFGEINSSSSQVDSGAKQIADGAQSLSQGSTEQAASIEQLSSSVSEIAGQTKVNAEMAEKAASLSEVIKGNAEKGNRQMDEMMEAVRDINTASQNISKVIKVIDDIAFQTNILALNAAVEAARAGQHGKGFAVVAEEVRNLAAKSAEAAKETGDMIQNSMEKAELGSRIASETAVSFTEISQGINESSQIVSEIAKSSKEQSMGISQINIGIDQVAQVVQQNSATAEESAAASEEMSGQSAMLQELISQFKLKY
ncbi:MAG: methyl-accepting chemotaxis protein [Oscillospiraceae bacterium]|nr:methyl-accepting chemotaxis protein [Oscillospiraceae bacterium]